MTSPISIVNHINMTTNYSPEEIEQIIHEFYSPTSRLTIIQRQQLNSILENFQQSKLAWDLSWRLLDVTKPMNVQFFSAVVLCNKISKHLSELDDQQIQTLFQQLIERLIHYTTTNSKQIAIKLTIALVHLILHMIPDKWKDGLTPIINLFTTSSNEFLIHHPEKLHLLVMNILTIFPEEFVRITVSKSQRSSIRLELEKEFITVLNYLQFIISTFNSIDIINQIFICLSKWLEFGISILQIEPFFDYLFTSLHNENLFFQVSDCLIVIFTLPDALKYPTTFTRLLPYVLQLESLLDQCLTLKDKAESITRLITQYGENLVSLIVQMSIASDSQSQNYSHQYCRLIMKCTDMKGQYPIEEISSGLTWNFWHALQEEIISINEENKKNLILNLFRPYFEHLIELLISKGQLPNNENIFTSEDRELFRSYRSDIIETMICMYNILGNHTMEILANRLLISVEQNQSWQIQESIIQLIGTGSEYMKIDENQILPQIFSLIPKLNLSNNLFINTTLTILGQYSHWLGNHPDRLENCVHLCINALSNGDLIQSGSIALKELIKENRIYMSKYLQDIFPMIKNVLDNPIIQSNDRLRCVSIVGYILSPHPSKIVIEHLNILLVPEINQLLNYLSETNNHQSIEWKRENICTILHFISVLITSIGHYDDQNDAENLNNTSEVLCCVLHDLDSIFRLILQQYADDIQITEKICEILSRTVTILRESSISLLDLFLQLLQHMGSNILHSEFLNFVRNTLLLFAKDTDKPIYNLFLAVLQKFRYLFNEDRQWLQNHLDIVEDTANFFAQIIKKLPNVIHHCQDEAFICLIQFMKCGIQLHEQGSLRNISTLISNFIEYTKLNQRAADLFQQQGFELVQILLKCIGGASPPHLIEHISFPLYTLSKSYIQWTIKWVQQCLNDPNFPTSTVKQEHREALMKILSSERMSRSNFKDHINTFSSACRTRIS